MADMAQGVLGGGRRMKGSQRKLVAACCAGLAFVGHPATGTSSGPLPLWPCHMHACMGQLEEKANKPCQLQTLSSLTN